MAGKVFEQVKQNEQTELENSDFGMAAAINSDSNEPKTFKHAWNHENETEKEGWRNAIKKIKKHGGTQSVGDC
jgi:hypothetical protein